MRPKKHNKDVLNKEERSRLMAKVAGKDTRPEMAVRRLLHSCGYRYRLHRKELPGSPDIVFPSRRKVIFVHGCFWHRHVGCRMTTMPNTRKEFWRTKFEANIKRDSMNVELLETLGWKTLIVWECETRNLVDLAKMLFRFLDKN